MSEILSGHENIDENNIHRTVGAKILSINGFRGRYDAVDSSFEKARKKGEKLVGKNDERRVDAYLERINRGVEKYGDRYEKRLWEMTKTRLIIDPEDIPDSYWRTQEQILRDNGQGRELSETEKDYLVEDIQKQQHESLDAWISYLSHEDCPYPTWFKVYTIDGVSKMGIFDKEARTYKKRDKGSVAPYPHFNPAVLAKVYGVITDFYGIDAEKDLGENNPEEELLKTERDEELEALIRSGNFNKLYSKLLLSEKMVMKTPENTEDIHGEWVEYGLGDEEEIAKAADGTPWCIAQPSVGRSYLSSGHYGNVYDDSLDNESKAKFLLFHLQNEDGLLAENACASIRLDTDGQVAEISGLGDGQALEDSLVPLVEEKVKSLPGGEKFLRRFADKNKLIEIDKKMQNGEDITKEEFRFIWELDRPIETLDTYNSEDPRIKEFREKYGPEYAAEKGYIIPDTKIEDIEKNIGEYLKNDLSLNSNLLTYVLKKKLEQNPAEFKSILTAPGVREKLEAFGLEQMHEQVQGMFERIKSLEVFETEDYIFLLPKDKWEKGKIELPNDPENRSLAPTDLTAILKQPVMYDYDYESDGRSSGKYVVYDEKWVGKEIRHFPWSKELFKAEAEFLKPNGYSIPESWEPITNGLTDLIAREQNKSIEDVTDEELSTNLREKLNLAFSGYVWHGDLKDAGNYGYFWSAKERSARGAYSLSFDRDGVNPERFGNRGNARSVRCVCAESGSFPNS